MTMSRNAAHSGHHDAGVDEMYSAFRNFTAQGEMTLQQVINYFNERSLIERNYFDALDKLSKKTTAEQTGPNNERTVSKAWSSLAQLTLAVSSHHQQLASCIEALVQELYRVKQTQQQALDEVRHAVKKQSKEYYELKSIGVPKLRNSYFKKHKDMESLEKENKEGGVTSTKTLKLAKDITTAEQGYRRGIQDLEEVRQKLQKVREQAQKRCEKVEKERVTTIKKALATYTDAEGKMARVGGEAVDRCNVFIECINPAVDCHFFLNDFAKLWPDPAPMYYESYTHGVAKDMVFGVPLETLLRSHPGAGIPAVLFKCIRAIEARGLDKEGIYRVSGKHTDVSELKLRVEKDVHSVNLEDDTWDIHVVAGLVKMYLRHLPMPVFPFPAKERLEYAQISDERERVLRLRQRVKALPRSHHTVLKFLVDHLAKVASHSAQNKMTTQNLALIFAPVVFQGQPDLPAELNAQGGSSLAAQLFGKPTDRDTKLAPDLSQYGIFKVDGVLEDLINLRDFVFSNELPRPPKIGNSSSKTSIPQRTDSLPEHKRQDSESSSEQLNVRSASVSPRASLPPSLSRTAFDPVSGPTSIPVSPDVGGMAGAVMAVMSRERPVSVGNGVGMPPVPMDRRDSLNVLTMPLPIMNSAYPRGGPSVEDEAIEYEEEGSPLKSGFDVVVPPLTVVNRGMGDVEEDEEEGNGKLEEGLQNLIGGPPVPPKDITV